MNKRALFYGLLLAALGTVTFFAYLRRFEAERSGGDPVQVLVVKDAVARGKTLVEDMVQVRTIPLAYVEDRCVKANERDKVVGLRIVHPLGPNQALMWSDFADRADEERDLSAKVEPGYRAVYVRAIREEQGSTLVRPGDFVDVISTAPDGPEARAPRASVVVLQKVMVLANGVRTSAEPLLPDPDDKSAKAPSPSEGLTLALGLQQAQALALAGTRGHLSIALRSREDERTHAAFPPLRQAALLDGKARAAIKLGVYDPTSL
jgi:pilus assembly protein CpaB